MHELHDDDQFCIFFICAYFAVVKKQLKINFKEKVKSQTPIIFPRCKEITTKKLKKFTKKKFGP